MKVFNIYYHYSSQGHGRYGGDVRAKSIESAYKKAVALFKKEGEHLEKISKFYVAYSPVCNKDKGAYESYGYSSIEYKTWSFFKCLGTSPFTTNS